jgi:hypothetical protein
MTFITAPGNDPTVFRAVIADAIAALPDDDADLLGLRDIVALPPSAYDIPLPNPPELP